MSKKKTCEWRCPYCNGININNWTLEWYDIYSVYYPSNCTDCGKSFKEWYSVEYSSTEYEEDDLDSNNK